MASLNILATHVSALHARIRKGAQIPPTNQSQDITQDMSQNCDRIWQKKTTDVVSGTTAFRCGDVPSTYLWTLVALQTAHAARAYDTASFV